MDFRNTSYPVIMTNVKIEKPLKHQRRLGLDYIHFSGLPSRYAYVKHIYLLVTTEVVWFCRLCKCLDASSTNIVDPDQTAPVGAVWSRSTLFDSKFPWVKDVSNYMQ